MSELGAFRFALRTAGALLPALVVAPFGPRWVVVVLAAAGVAAASAWTYVRRPAELRIRQAPAHAGPADERRILVVANDVLGDEQVPRFVEAATRGARAKVLLLAPAVLPAVRRWASDTDTAHAAAERRLAEAAAMMPELDVSTALADDDPLTAIEDAVRAFSPDEVLVCTRGRRSKDALDARLAQRVRERFALPVSHLLIDAG